MYKMTTENIEVILTKRYGIAEIAKLLGIPKRRIYYHVKKGWLKTERREIDHRMVAYGSDVCLYWSSFQ